MRRFNILLLTCFVVLMMLAACKPKVPRQYLQPQEFEDILYDCHLADAMVNSDAESRDYDVALYRQAVFKKYGITEAEFDSSLVYYTRHSDRLHKIFENLSKRFSEDALALGATATDINRYGNLSSAKDTTNLWRGESACLLMPMAPYHLLSFELVADSSYQKGDKIIFSFNCDFISRGGFNDGVAVLSLTFNNDSTASTMTRMSANTNYTLSVADDAHHGIKMIRGFIYYKNNRTAGDDAGLRLMAVDHIRMVRLRDYGKQQSTSDISRQPADTMKPASQPQPSSSSSSQQGKPQPGASAPQPVMPKGRPLMFNEVQKMESQDNGRSRRVSR